MHVQKLELNNPWVRIGLVVAVEVLVLVGWYGFYYRPVEERIRQLRQQRQELSGKVTLAARSALQIHRFQRQIDSLRTEFEDIQRHLFVPQALDQVVAKLSRQARMFGLAFNSVQPDYGVLVEGEFDGPTGKLPVQIEATGQFLAVGSFLDSLDRLDFYFEPVGLSLQYDPAIYPKLKVHLSAFLYLRGKQFPRDVPTKSAAPRQL